MRDENNMQNMRHLNFFFFFLTFVRSPRVASRAKKRPTPEQVPLNVTILMTARGAEKGQA